jgi:hypothetical protein
MGSFLSTSDFKFSKVADLGKYFQKVADFGKFPIILQRKIGW